MKWKPMAKTHRAYATSCAANQAASNTRAIATNKKQQGPNGPCLYFGAHAVVHARRVDQLSRSFTSCANSMITIASLSSKPLFFLIFSRLVFCLARSSFSRFSRSLLSCSA